MSKCCKFSDILSDNPFNLEVQSRIKIETLYRKHIKTRKREINTHRKEKIHVKNKINVGWKCRQVA